MKRAPFYLAGVVAIFICSLLDFAQAAKYSSVACPGGGHTSTHEKCCAFYALRDDLQQNLFEYKCGDVAHRILRLAFHDAVGFSLSGRYQGGGADGSIITFNSTELTYPANMGTSSPVSALQLFLSRPQYGNISAGDLIQFASAVGLSNCPGAPRLEFYAGRPEAKMPASDGTIPSPGDSVDTILDRMADAGFTPDELVYLLASHSVAHAAHVNSMLPSPALLDSTPEVFDSQFFLEVLMKGGRYPGNRTDNHFEAPSALYKEGEMRLRSDYLLARDNRTACTWQSLINNQHAMTEGFREAMAKLAVTGQDKSKLIDCSDAVPIPKPLWRDGEEDREEEIGNGNENGKSIRSVAYPPGTCLADVEKSCSAPFPTVPISSDSG